MKRDWILSLTFLIIFVATIVGAAFLPATATTIQATVVIDPEKINFSNPSAEFTNPYMLAAISFPKDYKDKITQINASTVLLDGVIPLFRYDQSPGKFKAFFDRDVVVNYLWLKVYHLGYVAPFKNVPTELTVTGSLYDGTLFSGSDTVYVSAR